MLDPHLTDEILALREKATKEGENLCRNLACKLSGGWAHVGPCEPCGCGLEHAIAECPTTKETPVTTLCTFHSKRGFQEAVARLLGPRPPCDHRNEDGERHHPYEFEHVWLVIQEGLVYLRAGVRSGAVPTKPLFVVSVQVYGASAPTYEPIAFGLDAKLLESAANAIPNDGAALTQQNVTLCYEHSNDRTFACLRIRGISGVLTIPISDDAGEMMVLPPAPVSSLTLPTSAMLRLMQMTRPTHGPGGNKPRNEAMHGVRVEFEGSKLAMVGTDQHRLHIAHHVLSEPIAHDPMLLPSRFVMAAFRSLSHHQNLSLMPVAAFCLSYGEDFVRTEIGGDTIYIVRKHGLVFPPYEHVVRRLDMGAPSALVRIEPLSIYLERLLALRPSAIVALLLDENKLTCRTDLTSHVDIFTTEPLALDDHFSVDYTGPHRHAKIDARYLLEAIRACGERVSISLGVGLEEPIVVAGDNGMCVVMPTRCAATDPEFAP